MGPRSTRKLIGGFVDGLYFPFNYFSMGEKVGWLALDGIDKREKALSQDKLIEESLDSYQFVKHAYGQYEAFKLNQNSTDMTEFINEQKTLNNDNSDEDLDDFMDEID